MNPTLYQVWRHNGRSGAPWRIVFEDRAENLARDLYHRLLPRTAISYAATKLVRRDEESGAIPDYNDVLLSDGFAPHGTSLIPDASSKLAAAVARENREAAAARRAALRVESTAARVRVAEPAQIADDLAEQEFFAEAEVAAVPRRRIA